VTEHRVEVLLRPGVEAGRVRYIGLDQHVVHPNVLDELRRATFSYQNIT